MGKERLPSAHTQRPVNLHDRPSPSRHEIARGQRVLARANTLHDIQVTSNERLQTAVKAYNRDITAIAYRGEPFIYDTFYTYREMHDLIPEIQALCEAGSFHGKHPAHSKENDLWETKFRGLSLLDIENMNLDPETHQLAPEDIRRLNRMFRSSNIFRIGKKDRNQTGVLEQLSYFASQKWIHPEIPVPRSLEKFQENITAYFDYYTSFLTDFNRDPLNESIMFMMLFLGNPYLPRAVSTYIPARLNTAPSSAIKLYKQRQILEPSRQLRPTWRKFEKGFLPSVTQAYGDNAFPEDLAQYQHYNEEIDSAAVGKMLSYIQETSTAEQQVQKKDEAENLLGQLSAHKRDVVREVMQNPKRRLEYHVSQDHPAEKITIIRNRDTPVFIMHFSDNVHLTLELDKTGRLFGVPPSLVKAYPHVSDVFISDILKPLLEKYKVKDAPKISTTSLEPPASDFQTSAEVTQEEDQVIKPPKRKRLMPVTVFESDPLPPLTPLPPTVKRFVSYSESKIKDLLGSRVNRQQAIVDQALKEIRNFEQGHTNGWRLRGEYSGITRLRFGDYRIFMDDLGNGNYLLSQIERRSGAYKPRA